MSPRREPSGNSNQRGWVLTLLMILSMSFWGGSWVSAKVISTSLPAVLTAFWRFFVHAVAFVIWMVLSRTKFKISLVQFIRLLSASAFLAVYNVLFFIGLGTTAAGQAGVIVTSLNPIFSFIIAVIFFSTRIRMQHVFGLVIGITGGLLLIDPGALLTGNIDWSILIFVLAALVWASLTNISRKIREDMEMVKFSFYLFSLTTLLLGTWAVIEGSLILPWSADPRADGYQASYWLNILYLALPAGVFANSMYFIAVHRLGAHRGASFTFVVPVSAVLFSYIFLGEIPLVLTISGGILALIAVYLINRPDKLGDESAEGPVPEGAPNAAKKPPGKL